MEAKVNWETSVGIFVFARGTEPSEVGDFRRIGEDFYCTVDLADLEAGKPLLIFDSAYRIARAMVVATARTEAAGEVDLRKIHDQIDALAACSDRIADMAIKARTIQQQRSRNRAVRKRCKGRPGSPGGGGSRGDSAVRGQVNERLCRAWDRGARCREQVAGRRNREH